MIFNTSQIKSKVVCTRNSARRRGISFSLSQKDVARLFEKTNTCHYFGTPLTPEITTIDRIDCNGSYSVANVVLCCKQANDLKNQLFENPGTRVDTESFKLFLTRCGISL